MHRLLVPLLLILVARPDLVSADPPRLMLNTGGPVGAVRSLVFSHDSRQLYAAGMGRTVQVWSLNPGDDELAPSATLIDTLRWEISRTRGVIFSIDLLQAPRADKFLAIGGSSARGDGYISIFDAEQSQLARVLQAHRQTVVGLVFSPDGTRLASVSLDGELDLWSVQDWQFQRLRDRTKGLDEYSQPLAFLDEDHLAAAVPSTGRSGGWQVGIYDLTQSPIRPTMVGNLYKSVTAIASDHDSDLWASADGTGGITVWKGVSAVKHAGLTRDGGLVNRLQFGADNRLLATTQLDATGHAALELWGVAGGKRIASTTVGTLDQNYAAAASRDGQWAATYHVDDNEIWLYGLKNPDGTDRTNPFEAPAIRLSGRGSRIDHVRFSAGQAEDRYRIRIVKQSPPDRANSDDIDFDLNLPGLVPQPDRQQRWQSSNVHDVGGVGVREAGTAAGWRLQSDTQRLNLRVFQLNGTRQYKITLDPSKQGRIKCYCWIGAGRAGPAAIAIGTQKQNGIFVYDLRDGSGGRLLRYYRDHRDAVTSLSITTDGKYLASSSFDQTVKIWSLKSLWRQTTRFKWETAWGAAFVTHGNQLAVTSLVEGGIAEARGLREDDVIDALLFVDRVTGLPHTARSPVAILQELESSALWSTFQFTVAGRDEELPLVVPGWEPVVTLFLSRDREWAVWTPEGYYAASASGDELFGWHLNGELGEAPAFFLAEQFRGMLERPQVIRRLLSLNSLRGALEEFKEPLPERTTRRVAQVASQLPMVQIVEPRDFRFRKPGEEVRIRAQIVFPEGVSRDQFVIAAHVNHITEKKESAVRQVGSSYEYEWQMQIPDTMNQVEVTATQQLTDKDAGRWYEALFVRDKVYVEADVSARRGPDIAKYDVHLMAIGAKNYTVLPDLKNPVRDAEGLEELINKQQGPYYVLKSRHMLTDGPDRHVTRSEFLFAIDELREKERELGQDDLLIVFVAGHGWRWSPKDYYFVPTDPAVGQFKLVDFQGSAPPDLKELCIPWSDFERLAELPCRKLFLLDTCYSGNVTQSELIRALKGMRAVVFTSTSERETAQDASIENENHSPFMWHLLNALRGDADSMTGDKDGIVTLREAILHVTKMVSIDKMQHPRFTPDHLLQAGGLPLATAQ